MATPEQIVLALKVSQDVSRPAEERKEATLLLQHVGQADASVTLQAFVQLLVSGDAASQLSGFALLRNVVRLKWHELHPQQQEEIVKQVHAAALSPQAMEMITPVQSQLAYACSDVALRAGEKVTEHTFTSLVVQLIQAGPRSAFVGCKVVQYLSEELGESTAASLDVGSTRSPEGYEAAQRRKRQLLAVMTRHGAALLAVVIQCAAAYFDRGAAAGAAGQPEAAARRGAVAASLAALASLVSWLPVGVLNVPVLVDAVATFLQTDDFKADVLEVLIKVSCRNSKQLSKDSEDYTAFYGKVGQLLAAAVNLLVPPSTTPARLIEDDTLSSNAVRICEALVEFVVGGHLLPVSRDVQLSLLQQLVAFLGSGHLPLSSVTLPAWRRLVQGHERKTNQVPGTAAPEAAVDLPQECLQQVMQHCVSTLDAVMSPTDDEALLPPYIDTVAEWKEVCSLCKSPLKYILGEAAACSQASALVLCKAVLQSTQQTLQAHDGSEAQVAFVVHRLDVTAFLFDAVVNAVTASSHVQDHFAELEALVNSLVSMKPAHAQSIARMGKVLEAIGPVAAVRPSLAPVLVDYFFALLDALHRARGQRAVGNDDLAPYVREQRQLTKASTILASKAPQAYLPLLDSTAERTLALANSGILGDADKNCIYDGLLASATSQSADLFARVVRVLVEPLRAPWQALLTRLAGGEAALIASMLSPISQASTATNGAAVVSVGNNEERLRTYYMLQLLVICARQAKSVKGGGEALSEHVEWMLLPALRLHRCVMGCAQPAHLQGDLAAIATAFDLSPLERAVCIGQQAFLDAKSRSDELEPGRSDPCSVHGVRNWIRQCKEMTMMLLSECAASMPHFWQSEALRQAAPGDLLHCLHIQEPRSIRMAIHHGMVPLVRSCPPGSARAWMPQVMQPLIAILAGRVTAMWQELTAKVTGEVGGVKAKQTEDEIIQEVLLRELSRDALELMRAFVGSTSFPAVPAKQLAGLGTASPYAFSSFRRARQRHTASLGGDEAQNASDSANTQTRAPDKGGPPLNSVPWEQTVARALLPEQREIVQAAVRLAAAAMRWPDIHTQMRAIAVCRTVAAAAGAPLNPVLDHPTGGRAVDANLQPLLVPCILQEALYALALANEAHTVSELLLLIRSIYIAGSPQAPSPTAKLKEMLPGLSDAVISQFHAELQSSKSEKAHKETLRRFFAQAGMRNLDALSEVKVGAATPSNAALSGSRRNTNNEGTDIQWPDLYDINVP